MRGKGVAPGMLALYELLAPGGPEETSDSFSTSRASRIITGERDDLFSQPRHGPVEMLEGQVPGSRNSITLSPALGGPVAARSEKSMQHGEINGPLHLKLITPPAEQFVDDLFEAE